MYAVVGCTECGTYWLLRNPGESNSATCPRCGRRHQTTKLRRFYESEDRENAREARAALLARKRGDAEAFDEVAHVADLEAELGEGALSEEEYLSRAGLDPEEVAAAGESSTKRSRSRDQVVRDGVRECDSEEDVLEYAVENGVPREAASDLLETLRRRGEVTESGGSLRLL